MNSFYGKYSESHPRDVFDSCWSMGYFKTLEQESREMLYDQQILEDGKHRHDGVDNDDDGHHQHHRGRGRHDDYEEEESNYDYNFRPRPKKNKRSEGRQLHTARVAQVIVQVLFQAFFRVFFPLLLEAFSPLIWLLK